MFLVSPCTFVRCVTKSTMSVQVSFLKLHSNDCLILCLSFRFVLLFFLSLLLFVLSCLLVFYWINVLNS